MTSHVEISASPLASDLKLGLSVRSDCFEYDCSWTNGLYESSRLHNTAGLRTSAFTSL